MTLPTADELLDFMERECLMVNVEDTAQEPKTMVHRHTGQWEAASLRAALHQAYREINLPAAQPAEQPAAEPTPETT